MSQKQQQSQEAQHGWVGLDWGGSEHAVSIVGDDRKVLAQFKVEATLEGFNALHKRLEQVGSIQGIALEATANMVIPFLFSKGYTVYLINPKLSKNWRESISVAGVKSDARDGHVLAVELARRHESLRPLKQEDSDATELAGLCEAVRDQVDRRTALVQQLKATLRQYYPAVLEFFRDWTSPVSWRFVKRFPRPGTLAKTHKATLCRFLKNNQIGLSPHWLARIERAEHAADWPKAADCLACEVTVLSVIAQLEALQKHIDKCDRLIAERTVHLPESKLIDSLPGTGPRLGPAITAMAALLPDASERRNAMRCLSGVAPVENSSGKRTRAQIRRRCNKHWRNVMHLYARMSIQHCSWARAFYDLCRERGDGFATALRKLADKWLKIIHRMLVENEPYDDQRYVEALCKSGSPVYARLCENARGKT